MKNYFSSIATLFFFAFLFFVMTGQTAKAVSAENNPYGLAGPYAPDDPNKINQLGVKYAREAVTWYEIETSDNVWDFSFLDSPTGGLAEQLGLEIIPRIKFGNDMVGSGNYSWAVKCNPPLACPDGGTDCLETRADCAPKDLTAWNPETGYSPLLTDFATRTLTEFFNHGKRYEYIVIGNEVNTDTFWHGTDEEYLQTRATIFNAVKRFNATHGTSYKVADNGIASSIFSNAIGYEAYCRGDVSYAVDFANRAADHTVARDITAADLAWLNCSDIGGPDYKTLKKVFAKDPNLGEASFDVMSYHFYEPWDVQEEVINWIKQEMRNNGYEPKPIINTEGGYHDTLHLYSDTPSLAQDVANDLPKLHTVAFSNGVKVWLWLPFTERLTDVAYGADWKGLVKEDQTLLPAFTSYQTMVSKTKGFANVEKINGLGSNYLNKINFPSKNPVYIVWEKVNKSIDLSSLIPGSARVTKVDGTSQVLATNNIAIGESPLYLESLPQPALAKTVDKSQISAGDTLTYTLNYSNPTAGEITNVRIEDSVPAGTRFLSADHGGTLNGNKVVWSLGNLAAGAAGSVSFQIQTQQATQTEISFNFPSYYLNEPVLINVKNVGVTSIALNDTSPWIIKDNGGQTAFDPGGDPSSGVLVPGQTVQWRWNQKNGRGAFVASGFYRFEFQPTGEANTFQIDPKPGSDGHFTFNMLPAHDQEFKVYMTQPQSIRLAIEHYYKLNKAGIPMGVVVDDRPGKSPYDLRWSWHLEPSGLHMAEGAIELCDGNPNWIERELDSWTGKTFCPWSSDLVGLQ